MEVFSPSALPWLISSQANYKGKLVLLATGSYGYSQGAFGVSAYEEGTEQQTSPLALKGSLFPELDLEE